MQCFSVTDVGVPWKMDLPIAAPRQTTPRMPASRLAGDLHLMGNSYRMAPVGPPARLGLKHPPL